MSEKDLVDINSFKEKSLKIYESLVSGKGINHIIQVSSEIMGNPISLSDSSYRLLEYSKDIEVEDPIWKDIVSFGYSSFEVVKKFNREKVIERIVESDFPVIIDTGIGEEMTRILGKVTISEKIVGYIGVFEVNHKLTKMDVKLADVLCSVLSVELSKNPSISNLTGSLSENLIIDLLNGSDIDKSTIQERLKSASWIPLDNFYLLYIPIEENSTANFKIEHLRSYLERLSPYFKSVYYNKSIVLLMNYSDNDDMDNIWMEIKSLIDNHDLKAGVSFSFSSLKRLNKYYEQGKISQHIGSRLNKKSSMYYFDDYYHLFIMNKLDDDISLIAYCHKGILKLVKSDKKNSTSYASTLYEYINNSYNLTNTAKKLYIHKNTMLHRLDRIKEISGIKSLEMEDMFKIQLTYKIMKYIEVYNQGVFD